MMPSMDEICHLRDQAQQQLAAALADIPGGRDLVEWFEGAPEFGDADQETS